MSAHSYHKWDVKYKEHWADAGSSLGPVIPWMGAGRLSISRLVQPVRGVWGVEEGRMGIAPWAEWSKQSHRCSWGLPDKHLPAPRWTSAAAKPALDPKQACWMSRMLLPFLEEAPNRKSTNHDVALRWVQLLKLFLTSELAEFNLSLSLIIWMKPPDRSSENALS